MTEFLGTGLTLRDDILSGTLRNGDPSRVRVYSDAAGASVDDAGTLVRFGSARVVSPPPSPPAVPEPASALAFGLLLTWGLARGFRQAEACPTGLGS